VLDVEALALVDAPPFPEPFPPAPLDVPAPIVPLAALVEPPLPVVLLPTVLPVAPGPSVAAEDPVAPPPVVCPGGRPSLSIVPPQATRAVAVIARPTRCRALRLKNSLRAAGKPIEVQPQY
jgi:hypothetical protein